MYERKNKLGISLIVLVITILVMIILAGVVVVSLSKNNPVNKAKEATFKTDAKTFAEELSMYYANMQLEDNTFQKDNVNAKTYIELKKRISSFTEKYNGKYEILNGNLVYVGVEKEEAKWAESAGIQALNAVYTEEEIKQFLSMKEALNTYATGKDKNNIMAKSAEELKNILGTTVVGMENKVEIYKGELYKVGITYADISLLNKGIGLKLNMNSKDAYRYMSYDAVDKGSSILLPSQAMKEGIKDVWPTYYGPYIKLTAGNYVARIEGENIDKLHILAYYNGGGTDNLKYNINKIENTSSKVALNIDVTNNPVDFELVFSNRTFLNNIKEDITLNKDIYFIKN